MERTEKIGLGLAIAGHTLLFALLSARFFAVPVPEPVQQQPLEVSLVKDVAIEAAAPKAVEPPAPSIAPDRGASEDAAPPEPVEAPPAPEPKPAPPVEKPAPPKPKPAPPIEKPAPPKPKPAPAKPVEKPAPAPRPVAAKKPAPEKKPQAEPVAAPDKAPAKTVAKAAPAKTVGKSGSAAAPAHAKPAAEKGAGTDSAAKTKRPRGSLLGDDFLKGLSDKPSRSVSPAPVAAKIDGRALASIQAAIARQIQPCADRQVDPGPGANRIVTTFNLHLNEDGSLAATPHMVRQSGTDDENGRYAQRVVDLGIAAFKGCTPLKLPSEFYSTPSGGWNNINYKWQLK